MKYLYIIAELEKCYNELSDIASPEFGKVNWTGMVGAFQELRNDSKFNKLCKTPIADTNYLNFPGYLLKQVKNLKEALQDNSIDNQIKAEKAMSLIKSCYEKWKSICPGIENITISDEIGKGVDLPLGVVAEYYLYEALNELKYSETIQQEIQKEFDHQKWRLNYRIENRNRNKNNSTGCLGLFLSLSVLSLLCIYLAL